MASKPSKNKKPKGFPTASQTSNIQTNPWQTKDAKQTPSVAPKDAKNTKNAASKFKEAQQAHLEKAKKLIESYELSSDEEEIESDTLLESVFKGYDGDRSQLHKTQEFLENVFQSGAATCLICIATVKRTDYIWSCENCFSFLHLNCVRRWATDSIAQQRMHQDSAENGGYYTNQGEYVPKKEKIIKWCCPKCRFDYAPSEIPRDYQCFCKKELNPVNHPWLVPHSCGEVCGKPLKSSCNHRCVILCHPGPCPPCARIVQTSCDCGQSNLKTIRCAQNSWKCNLKCKQKLACGSHVCDMPCHKPNECPPCNKKSQQACVCGNRDAERNCNDRQWHCDKLCNRAFECGKHKCKEKCHKHDDEFCMCPFSLPRSCPCGKESTQAPCSVEIDTCGNTCQKTLKCQNHICAERCHKGDCGQCLEIIEKKCRCGAYSKEFPCSKPFLCEAKCKRLKECNKHACNRKCCDGQCPPCDKVCGKMLSCGKHKCASLCHHGQCYPCTQNSQVKCRCGNTSISVHCGREKKTKPPKCRLPCRIPSKCHHTNEHNCHVNDCPPCTKQCLLPNDTTNCAHLCAVKCHDAVKIQIVDKNFKPAGPWDIPVEKFEICKLPHPQCEFKVAVECIGGHETAKWPCWNSKPSSCGRLCGRALKCGNHVCEQQCHSVENTSSMLRDKSCSTCSEPCIIPRPDGCIHPCEKRCHKAPCEPCVTTTKTSCHCGLNQVYYKCNEFFGSNPADKISNEEREKLLCCGNRCIKNFTCDHRCTNTCHSGQCKNEELCRKKMKIYCPCKHRKVETACDKIRGGFELACDDACAAHNIEVNRIAAEIKRTKQVEEDERNRLELEKFEKKFAKKRYKERKEKHIETKDNMFAIKMAAAAAAVAIAAGLTFYLFYSQ